MEKFKLSQSKITNAAKLSFSGDANLPLLSLGETVQGRVTIELFDALTGGGDCVLSDEAILNVKDLENHLLISE
jgi:hypothetical protein